MRIDTLLLNLEALSSASTQLSNCQQAMDTLRNNIISSFEQLRVEWRSDAGDSFFASFERELLDNLRDHVVVLQHMSQNLNMAHDKYQDVFVAADAVANAQY